ncbi:MAG: undecaprenyl-phosphate glucose phosphotransferase [Pirellulaceae bacterium]|nr:undecaprenyl-phosphate glucose phosphotransferase [Pirellulaceae bacterium]
MQKRSPITTERSWLDLLQPTFDTAAIFSSLSFISWLTYGSFSNIAIVTSLLAIVVFMLLSHLTGLHHRVQQSTANGEMTAIVATWFLTVLVLSLLAFATRYGQAFSRSVVFGWIVLAPAMIGIGRMAVRIVIQEMVSRGYGVRRVAIAGLNDLGRQTASNIADQPSLGLQVVGFYDDRIDFREQPDEDFETTIQDATTFGSLDDLVELARSGDVDTIMITLPMRAESRIKFLLDKLSDSTVSVYIVPDFFVFELLHSRWTNVGGLPAVSVFENPLFGVDGVMKRVVDLAIALVTLVVAAIPMLLIALAVKLSSAGPVFFRQKRYGMDGREILVWKFRSMRTCDNGPVVKQATKDDPRITRVGAILRKTSLDELPQLLNVIDGSMSLVGPRPHASAHNEQYRSLIRGYMLRHKVKPGITGLAQVNGCRGETETIDKMERRVEWDHQYIRRWSLWLDIKILFKTLFVVWGQETAY